jgi:UDP-glucose 4-epimerase
MNILVTGGAGFIGSHVVNKLVSEGHQVLILDNLSNSSRDNIKCHFLDCNMKFVEGDIRDKKLLADMFEAFKFDICYHIASNINVQGSIDNPRETFDNDLVGILNVLEECRKYNTKIVFTSTCMVYDKCDDESFTETATKPVSPYIATKIAGENMMLSYFYAYELRAVVLRLTNIYGPRQKALGEDMNSIYEDETQVKKLLFVKDCAELIVEAGMNDKSNGQIINAYTGESDSKAKELLGWEPKVTLEQGIQITNDWIKNGKQDIEACKVCSSDKSSCYMEERK